MNGQTDRQTVVGIRSIDDVIDIALRLADNDGIASVHVVTSERPTYAELLHCRRQAGARDLDLAVTRSSVVVKRHCQSVAEDDGEWPVSALHAWSEWLRERARLRMRAAAADGSTTASSDHPRQSTTIRNWLDVHGQAWRAGLAGMSEGTR